MPPKPVSKPKPVAKPDPIAAARSAKEAIDIAIKSAVDIGEAIRRWVAAHPEAQW